MVTPLISIIVLAHNRFHETTGRCLSSLSSDPNFSSWDLCVVDNASDTAERDALVRTRDRYPNMRLMLQERNTGFPGGMNKGLHEARGDPIFLITSDIVVPPGMIERMAQSFMEHGNAGLVGPVTDFAGNEQRIFVEPSLPLPEIIASGRAFADASQGNGQCVAAYRLDFCCVGIRRGLYDAIGGLDEAFSPGYYEDFDYSLRAREAGFDVLVAEHAFVHHEGSASFGRLNEARDSLIKRNKRLFLAKHGQGVALPHVREANLAVLQQYAARARASAPAPAVRIANRLRLAHLERPRSPFKRWRYLRRVAALEKQLLS